MYNFLKSSAFFCICFFSFLGSSQNDVFEMSRHGSVEQLEKLYHANPELIMSKNDGGFTPLTLACYNGNLEVVKFLVSKLDDINVVSKFGTPLMAATYKGHTNIVQILLEHKANTDLQDDKGETVAHYAVFFKKYDIIKLLVRAKANFRIKNARNQTAIDYAKMNNDEKINNLLNL